MKATELTSINFIVCFKPSGPTYMLLIKFKLEVNLASCTFSCLFCSLWIVVYQSDYYKSSFKFVHGLSDILASDDKSSFIIFIHNYINFIIFVNINDSCYGHIFSSNIDHSYSEFHSSFQ